MDYTEYQDFIITELKRQMREKFDVLLDMNFPTYDYLELRRELYTARDYQDLDYFLKPI